MQCLTELTLPTAVSHCVALSFLSAEATNLVVIKTSLLQIFSLSNVSVELDVSARKEEQSTNDILVSDRRINDDVRFESSFLLADSALLRAERVATTKLVLVAEYALSGTVSSAVRVKAPRSKSGGDYLLLSFRDAKLSLVEWDPELRDLSTISIHYYEQEELEGSPWAPNLSDCVNYLAVDPGSRCAALKFGTRNLAILPFKQDDEDVAMDDLDEEVDGPRPTDSLTAKLPDGDQKSAETPYISSFILRFSSLDPSLTHPIHFAFLHEYREPTFGILSSTLSPSATVSLLHERKDRLSYMVFTLDLRQRASTTILVVSGLPYDLFRVISLPPPIGGALLVGLNELIHIDQSGKSNAVGVNEFAKQCTSFGLVDQSELNMRLEGCRIEPLSVENGEMLIVLQTGELGIISFRMDGRSVSGLSLSRVPKETGGLLIPARASCASSLSGNCIFVGSENADSIVLGWSRKSKQPGRRRASQPEFSKTDSADEFDIDEDNDYDDDDDDLYGDSGQDLRNQSNTELVTNSTIIKAGDYSFRVNDSLHNIAPLRDITLSKPCSLSEEDAKNSEGTLGDLQLVAASGRNRSGALVILKREIEPKVIGRFDFPEAYGVWTMTAKKPVSKSLQADKAKTTIEGDYIPEAQFDRLMIVSKIENSAEESAVYALTSAGFEALLGTEFEPAAGATVEAGTLGNGMRVIQVLKSEVRSYDGDLGLAQILPMFDEETGAEPKIVRAALSDPFLFLIRDDASIFVARCDDDNELEEIERKDHTLLNTEWSSGCLYNDIRGIFSNAVGDGGLKTVRKQVLMFLMSASGTLFIYALPDLTNPVYTAEGVCFVPQTIFPDFVGRRPTSRVILTELLLADIGDATCKSPYLILRAENDDLTIYEPVRIPSTDTSLRKTLHFMKIHNPHLAKNPDASIEERPDFELEDKIRPMRAIADLGGYSTVFLPGGSPSFILRSAVSIPRVIGLRGCGVRGMSSFHTAGCDRGFIFVGMDGFARVSRFPEDTNFTETGMVTRKIHLGEEIIAVAYHSPMDIYVIGTSIQEEFELPKDDDYHREWQREEVAFKPLIERSTVKVITPINWSVIDIIELEPGEVIMCIKALNLETSETTHERKQLITVGTAISKGEDLAIRGCIYVYEVVTVVPEHDRPETNKKLKLITKEDIGRGAVTSISEIGTQGFMIAAQGQKCMVRGLKEDGTLLPVAFMDMNIYVTSVKELKGTGICIFSDALKGVWLAGYAEEPYKMILFGKQTQDMEVMAAEIFPIGKELYIVVADSDCNLHVLQFEPEHPKSLHGQILLHRTTFSLGGHLPTTMTLLPRTKSTTITHSAPGALQTAAEETIPDHEVLITTTTGAILVLSPLTEAQYRRLTTLANQLSSTLPSACGLNPKAYRINPRTPEAVIGGRPIVDGTIAMRWMDLGNQRRAEIASRVGVNIDVIRDDLETLMGGLEYL